MAASSFAPQHYSPPRETPWMVVALLAAAAVFGLWRGMAGAITEARETAVQAPAATTARDATALPAVAASTDTLIPPEARTVAPPEPAEVRTTPARATEAAPAAEPVTSVEAPVAAPATEDPRLAPEPTLQVLDKEPQPTPAPQEEPPPAQVDPYGEIGD